MLPQRRLFFFFFFFFSPVDRFLRSRPVPGRDRFFFFFSSVRVAPICLPHVQDAYIILYFYRIHIHKRMYIYVYIYVHEHDIIIYLYTLLSSCTRVPPRAPDDDDDVHRGWRPRFPTEYIMRRPRRRRRRRRRCTCASLLLLRTHCPVDMNESGRLRVKQYVRVRTKCVCPFFFFNNIKFDGQRRRRYIAVD